MDDIYYPLLDSNRLEFLLEPFEVIPRHAPLLKHLQRTLHGNRHPGWDLAAIFVGLDNILDLLAAMGEFERII